MDLDDLAQLHAKRADDAVGYATSTHSGVAAILQAVADHARHTAAQATEVYDNRLLFRLAADLDAVAKPVNPKRPTRSVN
jgi:hypothetical protein